MLVPLAHIRHNAAQLLALVLIEVPMPFQARAQSGFQPGSGLGAGSSNIGALVVFGAAWGGRRRGQRRGKCLLQDV
jgi:hypothetical protein